MHVLIADDDGVATELLALIVGADFPHATVDIANDGQQAVEMASAHRPDFAILDLEMPRLDGAKAARAIAACYEREPLCLIALSGNTLRLNALQGHSVFNHVQSKPCDVDQLMALLRTDCH